LPVCVQVVKNAQPECTGICRIVTGLAKSTANFGYETSVLFLGEGPLEEEVRQLGIPASVVPWDGSRRDLTGAWKAWNWLRKQRADIVHSHHGGLMVRAVCRAGGVSAVVQHIHSRILENRQDGKISDLSFTAADAVIASSQAVADCLPRCRAEVVYAGLESGTCPPPAADCSGTFKLGVLTRLVPLKNVEALLNAIALLRDNGIHVEADIAGSGPSEPSLRSLAESLGLGDRVHFLGWRPDTRELLASWNLLVISSNEESFPMTALEAMAAARPVIASRVGGLAEIVVDGVTGKLIPPGGVETLAASIAELVRDRRLADQMGVEGWKRIKAHFSTQLMASRTAAIYNRVLHTEIVPAT
jgi:glycosyltransferase involved in cell wall biosynthesis